MKKQLMTDLDRSLLREHYGRLLEQCKHLAEGKRLHAQLIEDGFGGSNFLGNQLVMMYGKCGSVEDAARVFNGISERSIGCWNKLVQAYARNGQMLLAKEAFDKMPGTTVVACGSMIRGYAAQKGSSIQEARAIFDSMPVLHCVICTALISGYGECGDLKEAKQMFDWNLEQDAVSWNALMDGYARNGYMIEARQMLHKMPAHSVISWTILVSGYAQFGHLQEAKDLFDRIPEKNTITCNVMISALFQSGEAISARDLFDRMLERNPVTWNAMVNGYAQNGHLQEAIAMFNEMDSGKDVVIWTTILMAFVHNGSLQNARDAFNRMPQQDLACWNAMLAAYAQEGDFAAAEKLFGEIADKDLITWSIMVAAHSQHGQGKLGVNYFRGSILEGYEPDRALFLGLLFSCSHAGQLIDCSQHFRSIAEDFGQAAHEDHYKAFADILARSGRLGEAEDLINNMPFEPDPIAWKALLTACSTNFDLDRARRAAECAVELEPQKSASYLLLLSILRGSNKMVTGHSTTRCCLRASKSYI